LRDRSWQAYHQQINLALEMINMKTNLKSLTFSSVVFILFVVCSVQSADIDSMNFYWENQNIKTKNYYQYFSKEYHSSPIFLCGDTLIIYLSEIYGGCGTFMQKYKYSNDTLFLYYSATMGCEGFDIANLVYKFKVNKIELKTINLNYLKQTYLINLSKLNCMIKLP
jgi:hypothetical protein